ncbi:hypothetical protein [Prochlorococcus marinus]|nr:hypothetical protein [Prochlorococcus marinus]
MHFISLNSLSRLFAVMEVTVFEMMVFFAVLDPLIKGFIQVALVIGPLSLVGVILLLRKIEKDHPERIRWK